MSEDERKDNRYWNWIGAFAFGAILLLVGIESTVSSPNTSNEVATLIGLIVSIFSGIQLRNLVININQQKRSQSVAFKNSKMTGSSIIQGDVHIHNLPSALKPKKQSEDKETKNEQGEKIVWECDDTIEFCSFHAYPLKLKNKDVLKGRVSSKESSIQPYIFAPFT